MGVADLIINGTLKTKKKEEEYSIADSIINGTYTPQNQEIQQVQPTIQSVQSTVNDLNTVSNNIKSQKEENKNKEENKKQSFSFSIDDKKKTEKDYEKERDASYNKLIEYKKEKGINLFNESKFKKDKTYQKLLKDTQEKQQLYDDSKVKRNTEKLKEDLEKANPIASAVARTGLAFGSGATRGFEGIESSVRKLTGQEQETQKYNYNDPMLNAAQEGASKGEQVAMNIAQSWGQMTPQMLAPGSKTAMALGFANYGGSAYNDAKKDGATEEQATMYGIASGSTEMLMEKLLGGFENIYGKKLGKDFTGNVMSKLIKNKAVRDTLSGMKGEFTEEYLQEFLEPILKNIILKEKNGADFWNTMKDDIGAGLKQLGSQFFNQKNLVAGLYGAASSGLLQGPINIANQRINNQMQQNTPQMEQQVQQPTEISSQSQLQAPIQRVQEQNNQILGQQQTPQITPLNQVNQELQETRQNDIANQVQAMNLEAPQEFTQKQGNYVYEKSDNSKIDNLRKDAANYLKEGEQTTNFVNTLEKLVKDKNIEIRFDTKLGNNVNGTYKNGVITINPNSNRAGEFVAIHELTHAIGTKPMIDMIQKYRNSNAEFNSAVERLLSTYKTTEINEEALGDIAGQLFGNQEYINNLSMENPSLFKKIYNEIKYLWHQFTGYKNQDQFIEDLRNKWESAYRNSKAKQTNKIGYSINEDTGLLQDSEGNDVTLETSKTGNTGTLMAIHNLNEDKLKGILELGGFPVPSIAITNPSKVNHSQFGNISVLFDKNTIDPAVKANEVFDRDVWSPTFPRVEYDINMDNIRKMSKENKIYDDYNDDIVSHVRTNYFYGDNLSDLVDRWGIDEALNRMKEDKELKYLYQKTKNNDYQPQMKPTEYSKEYSNKTLKEYVDMYNNNPYKKMSLPDFYYHYLNYGDMNLTEDETKALKNTVRDFAYKQYKQDAKDEYKKLNNKNGLTEEKYVDTLVDMMLESFDKSYFKYKEFIKDASRLDEFGETMSMDRDATLNKVNEEVNQEEFGKWVDNTFGKMLKEAKKGIRNDKEIFTASGNRRSFDKLHEDYNLQNIVSYLTSKKTVAGEEGFGSGQNFGTFQAKLSNKFNSIEDIKQAENKLQFNEETKELLDNYSSQIYEYMNDLGDYSYNKNRSYYYGDNAGYALNDFAGYKILNEQNLNKALENNGIDSKAVPKELKNNIIKTTNELKNIPTDYFEAKPQRAVGLDEVQQVVIPNNVDAEFKKQLQDAGLSYAEYDPNIDGDRQRVINQFDDLKFSKDNQTWREYLEKEFPSQGTRTDLGEITGRNKPKQENKTTNQEKTTQEQPKNEVKQEVKKSYLTNTEQNDIIQKYNPKDEVQPKERNTINESTKDDVVMMSAKDITNTLNDTKKGIVPDGKKMRRWVDTSNTATGMEDSINKADIDKITYEVQSNKKTYDQAVANTKNMSYEQKVFNAQNKLNTNKKITTTDLAEAQLALREAATKGDMKTYLNLQQDIAIMGTELGQMVQSLSMIQRLSPDGQLMMLQKIVNRQQKLGNKNWDGVEFKEELVQKVLDSYDDASHTTFNKEKMDKAIDDLKQDLADQMKVGISDKINEWRYLSMLGNPKTHIRNIVANVAMTITKRTKEKLNAGLQDLIIRDPSKKTATLKPASKEVKELSKQAYEETFEVNQGNKYNEKNEIENKRQIFKAKPIEALRKVNAKALDLEDQAFKKLEFQRAFSNYLTAQKIKTSQDIKAHPEIIQQAKAFALEESKIATFQQDNEFANWINKLDRKGPIAKVVRGAVIPFTRTPLNIAKTGLEYAPGTGLLTTIADVKKAPANMKGNVAINGISKQITGTSLALVGYALAKSGLLKSGEDDDKEGKFKKDQGLSMNFSIKLGDKFYDLSWLSPSSMPLFVGASMYEQLEKTDGINGNVVMEGIANTLDPLSEMSCISSFTDILQSFQKGSSKMISQMGQRTVQNYISQFVPTVSSQFARLFDTKKRTTNADKSSGFSWGQETQRQLMYKIPGLRNLLPEQTDYFGETKTEEENVLLRGLEAFLSPANSKKDIASEEAKELINIYDSTGNEDVLPSSLYKYIKYDDEKINMTSDEWNNYKKTFGYTLKDNLQEAMDSYEYRYADDDEKANIISGLMKYAKDKAKDDFLESKGKDYSKYSDNVDDKRGIDFTVAEYYIIKNEEPKALNGSVDDVRKRIDTANDIGISLVDYYNIKSATKELKADKNDKGKTISGSKKQKVIDYVNSINTLTEDQKNKLLSSMYKNW